MATTTINNITVTGQSALVKGQGPANTRIFVAIKTAGTMLGQGKSFDSGNFEIQTHNLNPGTYIAVTRQLEADGTVGNNLDWSNEVSFTIN